MSFARGLQRFLSLLLPGGLIAVVALLAAHWMDAARLAAYPFLPWVAPTALGLAFLLSLLFHQSRLAPLALVLAAVAAGHRAAPPGGQAFVLAALMVPATALAAALQADLRTLSSSALLRLLFGLILAGFVALADASALAPLVNPLSRPVTSLLAWTSLPAVAFVLVAVLVALLPLSKRRRTHALLLQTAALALVALELGQRPAAPMGATPLAAFLAFTAGTGLLLLWTVLDAAWQNAFLDELTGLPGRRPMEHDLASLGKHFALAIVDIDHFKRVNDRYGHETGDQVLRFVASQLGSFRGGRAYRYGGEEFVIVMAGGTAQRQAEDLNALRTGIASRTFVVRSLDRPSRKPRRNAVRSSQGRGAIRITVSIGLAARTERHRRPSEVLDAADKALYRAKRGGRNRLCEGA
jgi:diguanylate cyclase (GGDEF)-like protein